MNKTFKKEWGKSKEEELYLFVILNIYKIFDIYNESEFSILNLNKKRYIWLYDFLDNSGHKYFLKNKKIYLDSNDVDELNFITKNKLGESFFETLFNFKFKSITSANNYKNFLIHDYEVLENEKKEYEIFQDFCDNFSEWLLMDVVFNFKTLDIIYDTVENNRNLDKKPHYKVFKNIFEWDFIKIIDFLETTKIIYKNGIVSENIYNIIQKKWIFYPKNILNDICVWPFSWNNTMWNIVWETIYFNTRFLDYSFSIDMSNKK